jgi:hypothetical protein
MEITKHIVELVIVLLFSAIALAPLAFKSYHLAWKWKSSKRLRSTSVHAGKEAA